ncbi:MAG: hypothetical protein V1929_01685 [bacterium]
MRNVRPWVFVLFLGLASLSRAQTGRIDITQAMMPLTITGSGPYRLVENVRVTNAGVHGISVQASDVNIDLRGRELRGPGRDAGCGIYQAADFSGLTVSNGAIVEWWHDGSPAAEAGHGVLALGSDNMFDGIQLMTNTVGAFVTGRSVVSNCNVFAGRTGIRTGAKATVFFVTAYGLQETGFELGPASHAILCTCYGARTGYAAASDAFLHMCTAYDNRETGIEAQEHVHIRNCSTYKNLAGIRAGSHAEILNTSANGNRSHGIQAGHHSVLIGTASTENGEDGIRVMAESEVVSCSGSENGSAGIRVLETGCLVESNKTVGNSWGIRAEAPRNTIVGNVSGNNREQDYFASEGNTVGEILPFITARSNAVEDANFQL